MGEDRGCWHVLKLDQSTSTGHSLWKVNGKEEQLAHRLRILRPSRAGFECRASRADSSVL